MRASVTSSRSRSLYVILIAALFIGVALRVVHLGEPIGGFHSFNEAYYLLIASNFHSYSLLAPTADRLSLFFETPPLLSYILFFSSKVLGESIVAARAVPVASSILLMIVTALLTVRLFGLEAGVVAATILAVAPVAVITGRNIQTDSLYLLFVVAAFLVYPRRRAWTKADAARVGVLLALALFSKLFAAVAMVSLGAYEWIDARSLAPFRDGRRWAAAILAATPCAVFYFYQWWRDPAFFMRQMFHGAEAATTFPRSAAELAGLGWEAWWSLSPLISVAIIAALLIAVRNRSNEILFVVLPLAAYLVFYLRLHKHSYYLLSALPFAAALAGFAISRIRSDAFRRIVVIAILISGAFVSVLDVASMKMGFREFADLGKWSLSAPPAIPVVADESIATNALPIVRYYVKNRPVLFNTVPDASYELSFADPDAIAGPSTVIFDRDRYGVQIGYWRGGEEHQNPHYFRQGRYMFERVDQFAFGFTKLMTYPALQLRSTGAP
ncbi:MAG: ArnT family glycosyltransferase [Thermoanaerobaculia bacterium]